MNPEISKGLYVWGEFDQDSAHLLKSQKTKVNEKLSGPDFDVHLTLCGPINYNEGDDRKNFLNLSGIFFLRFLFLIITFFTFFCLIFLFKDCLTISTSGNSGIKYYITF